MGPTSRATVSISVTIAPHFAVNAARSAALTALPGAPGLCIETNGFAQFHLMLVRHSSGAGEREEALQSDASAAGQSACGSGNALIPPLAARAVEEEASPAEPLTVVVVPD